MNTVHRSFQHLGTRLGQISFFRRVMIWLSGFKSLQKLIYGRTNPISPWEEDLEFKRVTVRPRTRTLLQDPALFTLYQLTKQAANVDGDAAEVGVYKGGTALLFSTMLLGSGKHLHLFDTFEGMPETASQEKDFHRSGDFSDTSLSGVMAFLGPTEGLEFHPGFFPATASSESDARFCFVHVDVDIHQSVMDACSYFYPRLSKGGVMVFDDYGFLSCPGAKEAVDAFFTDKPEQPLYLSTAQAVVFKL